MARAYTSYTTAGGRTVTVVDGIPILATGYQCNGCFIQREAIQDIAEADRKGRSHASGCTSRRPYKPAYWGFI